MASAQADQPAAEQVPAWALGPYCSPFGAEFSFLPDHTAYYYNSQVTNEAPHTVVRHWSLIGRAAIPGHEVVILWVDELRGAQAVIIQTVPGSRPVANQWHHC